MHLFGDAQTVDKVQGLPPWIFLVYAQKRLCKQLLKAVFGYVKLIVEEKKERMELWQQIVKPARILFTMMKMNVMFAIVIWTKMKCTVF